MFNFISQIKKTILSLLNRNNTSYDGIILSNDEIKLISSKIKKRCNLLVFGVGNDSKMWVELNKKGTTKFLEDNKEWFSKIDVDSYLISYGTTLSQWEELIDKDLAMDLPKDITDIERDVILVDAPAGYAEDKPGRMKSIFMSKELIRPGGHVFVHDCDRVVEKTYFEKYLGTPDTVVDRLWHKVVEDNN